MRRYKCPKVEIVGSGEENIRTVRNKRMPQRLRGGEQEISWSRQERAEERTARSGRKSMKWKRKTRQKRLPNLS